MPDAGRRYLVVVQAAEGYPPRGAPLEPAPPDGPAPPTIHEAVLADEFEHLQKEHVELVYALHRLNVDWDDLARSCGDPKCAGDCRDVATVRAALATRRGPAASGDESHG